jgi:hypothetical protein
LVEPSDFTGLVERSLVGRVIPTMSGRRVAWVIAVSDLMIGVLLLATMRITRSRPFVLAWAGAWLLVVASSSSRRWRPLAAEWTVTGTAQRNPVPSNRCDDGAEGRDAKAVAVDNLETRAPR